MSAPAVTSNSAPKRYLAEFVGTAVLVIGGVGTAVFATHSAGNTGIALAFGLSLLAMAYAIGPISGCHINPAVTIGMLLARRLSPTDAVGYVVAQLAGATAGAALLYAIATGRPGYSLARDGLGANGFGAHSTGSYGLGAVAVTEVVLTFLLVFTVLAATDRLANAAFAGIPIGLVLTVCHLVAIPIDGTSVNPARSFGPALLTGGAALSQLWIFLIAPLGGAVVAVVIHRALFAHREPSEAPRSAVASGEASLTAA
jgi:aquaporin Z